MVVKLGPIRIGPAQCLNANKDCSAFVALLRASTKNKDLARGTRLHDDILRKGLVEECSDALVTMYAKCGSLVQSKALLDMYKSRDLLTWTALIAGFVQKGQARDALNYFEQMQCEGLSPDSVTYACILKACASMKAVDMGVQIHNVIAKEGLLGTNVMLSNALVNMYAKCGALAKAQQVIENLLGRDVISWNALISGYVEHGEAEQALTSLEWMQRDGHSPDAVTFACILKACGNIRAHGKGEKIHNIISKQGMLAKDIVLGTALVDMYAKCGDLVKARRVVKELPRRNVISWTALIGGYVEHGKEEQALACLHEMQSEGIFPNAATYICILKACGSIRALKKGEEIHEEIAKQGLLGNDIVLGSALVDMYAKCGALHKALQVLKGLSTRTVIAWTALIGGYVDNGEGEQALECFERMQEEGLCPNAVTFACALKACGNIGAIEKGESIRDEVDKQGLLAKDDVLATALVDMYAKCGALIKAQQVIEELRIRCVISWNALITGYVQQGKCSEVLNCLEQMQHKGLTPDAATFLCVLNACSHLGLVEDAQAYFWHMNTKFGMKPNLEHYGCMADLFGRAGYLDRAVGVIEKMPLPTSVVWSSLLGACERWGDTEVGKWASKMQYGTS